MVTDVKIIDENYSVVTTTTTYGTNSADGYPAPTID